jgi:hypothetical protein
MSRIFRQLGHGYQAESVNMVAQINGTTVFSGAVPTTNGPIPPVDIEHPSGLLCFEWTEEDTNFVGNLSLSITVIDGTFLMGMTLAQSNIANAAEYGLVYIAEQEGTVFGDPLTDVIIDGFPQVRPVGPPEGQWGWAVESGSTLTATIQVNQVPVPLPPDPPAP